MLPERKDFLEPQTEKSSLKSGVVGTNTNPATPGSPPICAFQWTTGKCRVKAKSK